MGRRRKLLPHDFGLVARMAVAAVVTPLIVIAALALIIAEAPLKVIVFVAISCAVGAYGIAAERKKEHSGRELTAEEAPELHAIVERLCLLADLPKPKLVLEGERQPNSWVVGAGDYRLHLTQ